MQKTIAKHPPVNQALRTTKIVSIIVRTIINIMKTILITLITATVALGNTLPPTPENTLPPTWDLVPKEHASWELVSQDDFEITPHLEA